MCQMRLAIFRFLTLVFGMLHLHGHAEYLHSKNKPVMGRCGNVTREEMNRQRLMKILAKLGKIDTDSNLEQWKYNVLDLISENIYADQAVFISQQGESFPSQLARNSNKTFIDAYLEYYYKLDPFQYVVNDASGLTLAKGPRSRKTVVELSDVIPSSKLRDTEYYQNFLNPQGISHETIVYLKSYERILGVISFMRRGASGFKNDTIDSLRVLAPFLATFLENVNLKNQVDLDEHILHLHEGRSSSGLLVLDVGMNVIYLNDIAREIFFDMGATLTSPVPAIIMDQCRLLLKKGGGGLEKMPMALPVKTSITVKDQSFDMEVRCFSKNQKISHQIYFAVSLESSNPPQFNKQKIRERFQLTNREAEIIYAVFKGLKNVEIAEHLYISETTVKKHIQNICGKLKVKSRTAIIYLILQTFGVL